MIVVVDSNGNAYPASHLVVTNLSVVSIGVGRYSLGDFVTNVATVTRNVTSAVTPGERTVTKISGTAYSTENVVTDGEQERTSIRCSPWVTDRLPKPFEKTYCIVTVTKEVTP